MSVDNIEQRHSLFAEILQELRQMYGDSHRFQFSVMEEQHSRPLLDEIVAVILSQNTTNTNSSRAFHSLKTTFPTWEEVLHAAEKEVAESIRSAGLAATKAPRIQALLRSLEKEQGRLTLEHVHEMAVAEALQYLTSFHGIGIKTAACVLLFGAGREVCPVDTHVFRLLNRLGVTDSPSPEKTFDILHQENFVPPQESLGELHVLLIEHGRRTCKARAPLCSQCSLSRICPAFHSQ